MYDLDACVHEKCHPSILAVGIEIGNPHDARVDDELSAGIAGHSRGVHLCTVELGAMPCCISNSVGFGVHHEQTGLLGSTGW